MSEQEAYTKAVNEYSINRGSEASFFWQAALEWARNQPASLERLTEEEINLITEQHFYDGMTSSYRQQRAFANAVLDAMIEKNGGV